jgi:hypothetical protein
MSESKRRNWLAENDKYRIDEYAGNTREFSCNHFGAGKNPAGLRVANQRVTDNLGKWT